MNLDCKAFWFNSLYVSCCNTFVPKLLVKSSVYERLSLDGPHRWFLKKNCSGSALSGPPRPHVYMYKYVLQRQVLYKRFDTIYSF